MLKAIHTNILHFFTRGHQRSVKAKMNVLQSVLLKVVSVGISMVLIPLTINYVNATQFGVWLTLSSIITWALMFDMGLGNGLKNKLTQAITLGNYEQARSYVSSTYAMLIAIAAALFVVIYTVNPFINWAAILNVGANDADWNKLVLLVFCFFCVQFVAQLINTVLTANQAPAKVAMLNVIGQVFTLVAILMLMRIYPGSLVALVVVMGGIPLLVSLIASFWYYKGEFHYIAPSFKLANKTYAREMLGAGGLFFFLQINALVLYETDNIVITQIFGPQEVTTFNVVYKLFSVVLMFFVVIITPFWSACTEAFIKDDYAWIKRALAKINKLWLALCVCSVALLVISPWVYKIWLKQAVTIPFALSLSMCIQMITLIWQAIHVQLLNGIGKIKLQFYVGIVGSLANIPLSIFLGKSIGIAGVPLSNTIIFIVMGIVFSIQTRKIINKTATGIFNA
ncbi:oligosaccharide flippase family protein [Mucilaginibacter pallidiroseus]|uniref:Oligosaccharide flippase family protein n=1 Tax=Mucilaginibacter pallidiroseus TaxID=2599295 RepID=A0A563U1Z7_9SPHI|nr:oligosaccharide flippase family protein [Mucilaginibacter pallidiroseus]TWR25212.1 oligosaccharide flippase family protein [Mucilaginibacter pallidiroseus]